MINDGLVEYHLGQDKARELKGTTTAFDVQDESSDFEDGFCETVNKCDSCLTWTDRQELDNFKMCLSCYRQIQRENPFQ